MVNFSPRANCYMLGNSYMGEQSLEFHLEAFRINADIENEGFLKFEKY